MGEAEKEKLRSLIGKYNDVLLNSMTNAVAEDLFNLILVNGEDSNFELKDFINKRSEFKAFVMREFLRHNSSTVASDLKRMSEQRVFDGRKNRSQTKLPI